MTGSDAAGTVHVVCTAERILPADPARVWMLVADPARVGEWAAVDTVGYMGTELPKQGQVIFVRTRRWQRPAAARRIEVEEWEAGSRYRCALPASRLVTEATFEVEMHPEPSGDRVATRIKLMQRMDATPAAAGVVSRLVDRRLRKLLNRIEQASL